MTDINPKNAAIKYLNNKDHLTAVVGSASAEGMPHAAVVYFAVQEDFTFYFLTAKNTQKYNNLVANPQASIVIGFGPGYVTMQGQGSAQLLEKASDEEHMAIALIKNRLSENKYTWPLFQLSDFEAESVAVFKLTVDSLHLLNLEDDCGLSKSTEGFQQIV